MWENSTKQTTVGRSKRFEGEEGGGAEGGGRTRGEERNIRGRMERRRRTIMKRRTRRRQDTKKRGETVKWKKRRSGVPEQRRGLGNRTKRTR